MGQEKERQIEREWQQQQREQKEWAESGAPVPPIRPPEFDRDD